MNGAAKIQVWLGVFTLAGWAAGAGVGSIVSEDPAFGKLVAPDARMEVIATGHIWTEGPVWDRENGWLLYSDAPQNSVFAWRPKTGTADVFLKPSGYTGLGQYGREPGSNGLSFDAKGQLLSCEHGDRRISVLLRGGGKRTLVDAFEGKRLNSPNDLCMLRNGAIFFTDPPYGLPEGEKDARRELDFFGVFRLDPDGSLHVVDRSLERPNGVALSPDQKTLYVAQSHGPAPIIRAYDLDEQGKASRPRTFFDARELGKRESGAPDGLKTDVEGNVWTTGPGGILVLSPEGKLLGRLLTGRATSNCAWGEDGKTLFITAKAEVLRLRCLVKGAGW